MVEHRGRERETKKSRHKSKIFRKNISVCSRLLNAGIRSIPPGSISKAPWLMHILQSLNLLGKYCAGWRSGCSTKGSFSLDTRLRRMRSRDVLPKRGTEPDLQRLTARGPGANTEHWAVRIDSNWDLWHGNGRHRGIFLLNGDLNMAFMKKLSIM